MSLFKSNAWILMRSGTATLPFMLVLSVVFNVLWLQKSLDPGTFRYVKTYLLITCLPSLFFGFLLGIGLAKLKTHYLWAVNTLYRFSILKSALILAVIGALLMSSFVTLSSELSLHYILIPVSFSIIGLLVNSSGSIVHNILRNLFSSSLLILMMFEATHEITQIIIFVTACYAIYSAFQSPTGRTKLSKTLVPTDRQSVIWWNQKLATFTAKFKKSFNKDIAWAVCYPQTKIGYLGGYFAAIFGFLFATTDNEVLINFMLLSLVLGCQFPVYQEFNQLKHQIKSIAHCFDSTSQLIKHIIYAFDKVVLRNTVLIFAAMVAITLFRQDAQEAVKIAFLTVFATTMFLAFAPLLIVYFSGCINLKNIALFAVICVLEVGVFGLVHYTSEQLSIYLICILVALITIPMRYFTQQLVMRQPLERIIN
ncbi:MAG: hypothetical protein ACPGVL_08070 [Pseudoalteromonas spongiae]